MMWERSISSMLPPTNRHSSSTSTINWGRPVSFLTHDLVYRKDLYSLSYITGHHQFLLLLRVSIEVTYTIDTCHILSVNTTFSVMSYNFRNSTRKSSRRHNQSEVPEVQIVVPWWMRLRKREKLSKDQRRRRVDVMMKWMNLMKMWMIRIHLMCMSSRRLLPWRSMMACKCHLIHEFVIQLVDHDSTWWWRHEL